MRICSSFLPGTSKLESIVPLPGQNLNFLRLVNHRPQLRAAARSSLDHGLHSTCGSLLPSLSRPDHDAHTFMSERRNTPLGSQCDGKQKGRAGRMSRSFSQEVKEQGGFPLPCLCIRWHDATLRLYPIKQYPSPPDLRRRRKKPGSG